MTMINLKGCRRKFCPTLPLLPYGSIKLTMIGKERIRIIVSEIKLMRKKANYA
jgi:hypothetical protein